MPAIPTATRAQLGRELQKLRLKAGLNTTQAAEVLRLRDPSTYRKYEAGKVTIPYAALKLLLDTWSNIGGVERQILFDLREQAEQDVWWSDLRLTDSMRELVGFEQTARCIRVFELAYVYGPLQTEAYARAVLTGTNEPGTGRERVEEDLRLRMERQIQTFQGPEVPQLLVLLDESVLRRNIGGPTVMREQLATLANVSGRSELRVLPFSALPHPGLKGAFWLFEFDDDRRPALYVEGPRKNFYLDDPPSVERSRADFETLWKTALNAADSRELVLEAMEAWRQ